jgi:hypothetical protein
MLTNEQQLFWSYFKWNPGLFAISEAESIQKLSPQQQRQRVNHAFDRLLDNEEDPLVLARVVKTWLFKYRLEMDPGEVSRFGEFHVKVRDLTRNNLEQIKSLETY